MSMTTPQASPAAMEPMRGAGPAVAPTARQFRDVLGHFPTGVVVVTSIDEDGQPVGMVIGSFTSVSLDPPLVAFLPSRDSRTFAKLRTGSSFCVNVLASEQEHVCRHFASQAADKFADTSWRPAPSGAPIIEGVVAWIDCSFGEIVEGGDHYVVFGEVAAMNVETPVLPLLFFQGGYGRFTPGSLVIPMASEFIRTVLLADLIREDIEELAAESGAECSVVAVDAGDAVFVASANASGTEGRTRLGVRVPIRAPLGPLFVGEGGPVSQEEWLCGLGKVDEHAVERGRAQLRRVQQRGWSVTLHGGFSLEELDSAVEEYTSGERTPSQERHFASVVQRMSDYHEPDLDRPDDRYDVLHVSVPVRAESGEVAVVLRLAELPRQATGAQIGDWVDRLQSLAGVASKKLAAAD